MLNVLSGWALPVEMSPDQSRLFCRVGGSICPYEGLFERIYRRDDPSERRHELRQGSHDKSVRAVLDRAKGDQPIEQDRTAAGVVVLVDVVLHSVSEEIEEHTSELQSPDHLV